MSLYDISTRIIHRAKWGVFVSQKELFCFSPVPQPIFPTRPMSHVYLLVEISARKAASAFHPTGCRSGVRGLNAKFQHTPWQLAKIERRCLQHNFETADVCIFLLFILEIYTQSYSLGLPRHLIGRFAYGIRHSDSISATNEYHTIRSNLTNFHKFSSRYTPFIEANVVGIG